MSRSKQCNAVLDIEIDMQSDVNNISVWFSSNKLVHTDKSGYRIILLGTRQKFQNARNVTARNFPATLNQNMLEDYAKVPYLGMLLSKKSILGQTHL